MCSMAGTGNDLLCKVHNPLKDCLVMKKIGNRPITKADTDFFLKEHFDEFWNFMSAHFGTVTQCSVKPTVPKCAHEFYVHTLAL